MRCRTKYIQLYPHRYRLLDSLVVECWHREVPGSIPSQGPRHTKDVMKMGPVVPLFSNEHLKFQRVSYKTVVMTAHR